MDNDERQLKLLGTLHYVYAGVSALAACVFLVHLLIGVMMIIHPESMQGEDGPPPEAMGWMFAVMGAGAIFAGWAFAVLVLLAGRALCRRVRHVYCMVIAALCCLSFPLGTALGVFSLVVLARPSVKGLFISGTDASRKRAVVT